MRFSFPHKLIFVLLVALTTSFAFAREYKKSEMNRIIPEGEYLVKSGKRIHHGSVRRSSAHSTKKYARAKPSRPARHLASKSSKKKSAGRSAKKSSKHGAKKSSSHKKERHTSRSKSRRFPVARETPNERDMPFVSIPHRRVGHADRTIVMEDPAIKAPLPKPRRVGAALKPDGEALDPESEAPPTEVSEAKAAVAPPVAGPAPASVGGAAVAAPVAPEAAAEASAAHAAAESASREPDAFDLHSGQDPMHGP